MTESKRNSNMELLRVVAMLMIIAYHIYCHCVNSQLSPSFIPYKKLLPLTVVSPMGQISNAIFLIISGYFMAGKERGSINMVKISQKLLFQLGFAALLLTLASTALHLCAEELGTTLTDINEFNTMAWYVGYYFLVILIAYMFLNGFLAKRDRKEYGEFLIIIFAVTQFSWSAGILQGLSDQLPTMLTGVFLYSLGGYIKRYDPFGNIKISALIGIIALVYLLLCLATYDTTANNVMDYQRSEGIYYIPKRYVPEVLVRGIVPITISVALFEIFKRMSLPRSRVINYLGASTFMVYLIHDSSFFYSIWCTQDWFTLLYYQPLKFICKHALWTLGTFAIGVAAYSLYLLLVKLVKKYAHVFLKKDSQCSV